MVTIDDRQVLQHPDTQELLEVPSKVERLDAADFCFLDIDGLPVGIEHCHISNLLQKVRSGELETQLTRCSEQYSVVYLLVEGVYDGDKLVAIYKPSNRGYYRSYIYPNTHYDYIAGLLVRLDELGLRILSAANYESSMKVVKAIYQQRTKTNHSLFQKIRPVNIPVKMSANPNVPRLMGLCKRMPEKVAIQLISKYGTVWNVLHTPDKELMEIDGFGKVLLARLKESVGCNQDGT